jgi:hypothetical protein
LGQCQEITGTYQEDVCCRRFEDMAKNDKEKDERKQIDDGGVMKCDVGEGLLLAGVVEGNVCR